ncbi:hypothetical protein [Crocosphaera sp.]|uniref:hypothetical protein n=1 Tax=Crocosphaera sp. TaxID=2729996 RepID=UPI0026021F02|nr:hypothetical protein [Crocosphaera sp.]MDJ0580792.1 hypothetical protein [Crocosphaera sp.]
MLDTLSYGSQASHLSSKGNSSTSVVNPQSSTSSETENNCNTCVDDYSIPPCTGFSKDYSCLPNLND